MTRRMKLLIAAGIGIAIVAGTRAYAMQGDAAALRATGQVGEKADGYLGMVGSASAQIRAQVDAINIQRRARYTELAAQRGATIEEVAAATACQIFASRIGPGQKYMLEDGAWREARPGEPVPLPRLCR